MEFVAFLAVPASAVLQSFVDFERAQGNKKQEYRLMPNV